MTREEDERHARAGCPYPFASAMPGQRSAGGVRSVGSTLSSHPPALVVAGRHQWDNRGKRIQCPMRPAGEVTDTRIVSADRGLRQPFIFNPTLEEGARDGGVPPKPSSL
jgi:hypothetical protein